MQNIILLYYMILIVREYINPYYIYNIQVSLQNYYAHGKSFVMEVLAFSVVFTDVRIGPKC
jgi:hypothetical protein